MKESNTGIAVLAVGDELLSGEVKDTNFEYLANEISGIGLKITRHYTVSDDIKSISDSIMELLRISKFLIITGGLGPTTDDLTRESVADAFGLQLEKREELESYIKKLFEAFGRDMPKQNLKQAMIPEGAGIIEPAGGTAAGIRLETSGKIIFALPGVPREMKSMFKKSVFPELKEFSAGKTLSRTEKLNLFGIGESEAESKIYELIGKTSVKYGFLAGHGGVCVKLTAEGASSHEIGRLLDEEKKKVYGELGRFIYSEGDEPIEKVLSELLVKRELNLAVAESLTAGMVCDRIVNVPGSSRYFAGGVVVYSKDAKEKILGINKDLLKDGAVNEKVAVEMAESVRKLFSTDIGVSTTGIAGPGLGGEKHAAGTVCIGIAYNGGSRSWTRKLPGARDYVRNAGATAAINAVRLFLIDDIEADI